MVRKRPRVRAITRAGFKPFGLLIDYPGRDGSRTRNLFRIVAKEPRAGWRIAYLVVRDKTIDRIEQHPGSLESFEPVKGRGLLYVATKKDPDDIKCFLLDKPVILRKGIWHGVVTLTKEFDIKIVENAKVGCVYRPLGYRL